MSPTRAEVQATLTAPGQIFEVSEEAVGGLSLRVWKHAPPSLRAIVELSRLHADKVFLVYEDERMTFEEHFRQVATLAQRLVDVYGVTKGDRVAIAMRNFPEWPLAFFAAAAAGAVVVPLNAWWTGAELEYGLADSGTKVLFADAERVERLDGHLAELGLAGVIVARAEGALPPGHAHFADVVGDVTADVTLPEVAIDADDDATIFYTSGTTGRPKGALGTQRNICSSVLGLAYSLVASATRSGGEVPDISGLADRPQDATLLSVPFFHVTGCHAVLLGNIAFGGKLVIMYKWDPERALELIERERITAFGGVPSMVWQVLESPDFAKRDISSVKSIGYGGAPAPPELVRRIDELFPGRTPSNGFGMTETSAGVTMNSGADYLRKPDSVGPPLPVCDVRVVDPSDRPLGLDELGELQVRGPNVVKGYWNKPEATAETFTADGWLRTGDIARIDEEGFVYIVDRAKDMVIRGGENVYCAEVEAALFEHPAVSDVAVIGVPHQVLGEEVGAVIQLRPGMTATAEELQAHVRSRLAPFKVPAHVWLRAEPLPRNPAGKIMKRELRDEVGR
jgi:acyl-CoA synthetase (AMP-forming)/AMP-acid ligase II